MEVCSVVHFGAICEEFTQDIYTDYLGNKNRKDRANRFRDFGAIKAQIPRLNLVAESLVAKIDCQRKQGNNKSHFFPF